MANAEQVIEPMAQSSTAQNLNQRRFLHDFHNLSPDELDSLMSTSGKKNNQRHLCIKWIKSAVETFTQGRVVEVIYSDTQMDVLSLWYTIFLK